MEVAKLLAGVDVPWCVAAGWALDLFHGEVTREHEDLEIAVPAGSAKSGPPWWTSTWRSSALAAGGRWKAWHFMS